MNIVRWDPFEEVGTLRRSMDRMLDEFFTRRPGRDGRDQALEWEPAVEMFETDQAVVVRAEMPNIDPKTVDVTVTDGALTLRGETRHEEEHKGRNYFRRELRAGAFTHAAAADRGEERRGEGDLQGRHARSEDPEVGAGPADIGQGAGRVTKDRRGEQRSPGGGPAPGSTQAPAGVQTRRGADSVSHNARRREEEATCQRL